MVCPANIFCILPFSFLLGCTHRCDDDRTTTVVDNPKSANNADPRQTGDAVMAGVVAVGGAVLVLA
ncbi:uncharacterized protein PG986_006696 [Apiospora aurea]|uniref:Uncharacterized protein n=1 Tax=Apiospora aurea TaxID=335848 RepID=A0ABR1QAI5_9PEZI